MIDLNKLINFGIYDLRNYARGVGVPHPSTLSRSDLISSIMRIQDGEQSPCLRNGRGRPPKIKDFDISAYAENATSNDIVDDAFSLEMQKLRFGNACMEFIRDIKKISTMIEKMISKYDLEILDRIVSEKECK